MATGAVGLKRLLVVDNDPFERAALNLLLRGKGFTIEAVATGERGLDCLRTEPAPDLVLLDMMLSGGDGWHFFRERNQDPHLAAIPVIILTSLDIDRGEWATSLGAVAYFRKPIHFPALLLEIRRLLGP